MSKKTAKIIRLVLQADLDVLHLIKQLIKPIIDAIPSAKDRKIIGERFLGPIHSKIIDIVLDLRLLESPQILS
ncbi:hypothetical protein LCGC14_0471660 [marine sediment metagenome]|uniref:Uncharacterized protein n=1 Tax=marine sediment metagenome TaxID=412755 RepID=A0A0F9SHA9_9ZZZZ|nr:MAG: hypothetical protein Lokiarch_25350 [Candidatus Lokiarchaeum sp. GC14_75]HEC37609.1 hypothetical protein [bacterium]